MNAQNEFPSFVGLSLTVRCQGRCIYCPSERGKRITPKDMPFELAVKIIDEISKKNSGITISLNENGEGLLYPQFIDVLRYLRDKMPDANVILHTNMERMNQNMAREVLSLGLNEIFPNMDGASKETFEYAKRLNFERVKKNLEDFIRTRNAMESNCKIVIQIMSPARYLKRVVGVQTILHDDSKEVEAYWKPLIGPEDRIVNIRGGFRWAIRDKVKKIKTGPCLFLNGKGVNPNAYIAPSGDMYVCCLDENAQISFGNVIEESIEDIWNGDQRHLIMKTLLLRQFDQLGSPCIYCDQSPLSEL